MYRLTNRSQWGSEEAVERTVEIEGDAVWLIDDTTDTCLSFPIATFMEVAQWVREMTTTQKKGGKK